MGKEKLKALILVLGLLQVVGTVKLHNYYISLLEANSVVKSSVRIVCNLLDQGCISNICTFCLIKIWNFNLYPALMYHLSKENIMVKFSFKSAPK